MPKKTEENILRLVNSNGEVERTIDRNTHHIRSNAQDKFYRENLMSKAERDAYNRDTGKFIWSYPAKVQELIHSDDFTKSDITMIFYLATYVNGLGYLTYENRINFDKRDIHKVLGNSRNLFNRFYNKLVEHDILLPITENEETVYKWNNSYNFYGTTAGIAKPTELIRTYVKQIQELYEAVKENGKKRYSATSLYPIFALVPHLHVSTNIVCKNPEEKNINLIEYYTMEEIADLLDVKDSKQMTKSISSILLDGQTTFLQKKSKNERFYQLNPRIFWRDVEAPPKHLVAEFSMIDYNRSLRRIKRENKAKEDAKQ